MTFLNCILLAFGMFHAGSGCEKGWTQFKDHCYFVSQQKVTFAKALIECNDMGGWLVALETAEESDWLRLHLTVIGSSHVYIGGTDMMEEGIWRWMNTGTVFKLDHWKTGEPDGKTAANCVVCNADRQFKWSDVPCRFLYVFVCERRDDRNTRKETGRGCFAKCC